MSRSSTRLVAVCTLLTTTACAWHPHPSPPATLLGEEAPDRVRLHVRGVREPIPVEAPQLLGDSIRGIEQLGRQLLTVPLDRVRSADTWEFDFEQAAVAAAVVGSVMGILLGLALLDRACIPWCPTNTP